MSGFFYYYRVAPVESERVEVERNRNNRFLRRYNEGFVGNIVTNYCVSALNE